jgi:hypothetical protein
MANLDLIDDARVRDNYRASRTSGSRKTIAIICPVHGFIKSDKCSECEKDVKHSIHVNTGAWVEGWWDHIDREPIYISSKKQLLDECEKRGLMARAFMKPKSQGRGFEHRR